MERQGAFRSGARSEERTATPEGIAMAVAHVVLFTPKPTLSAEARAAFLRALEAALAAIPEIERARVGRRLASSPAYERLSAPQEYLAVLEFASADALRCYLEHPAHDALAEAFHASLDEALVGDYELADDIDALPV